MLLQSSITPAFRLLIQAIRITDKDTAVKEVEQTLRNNELDWEDLLKKARIHFIEPQLEELLKLLNTKIIPEFVSEKLKESNRDNLLRQLRNISAFFEIEKLLKERILI